MSRCPQPRKSQPVLAAPHLESGWRQCSTAKGSSNHLDASCFSNLSSFSKTKIASTTRAGSPYISLAPISFQAWNSSSSAMLSGVMYEVGQLLAAIFPRAQTTSGPPDSDSPSHLHRRFFSKPLLRHVSHFHAA